MGITYELSGLNHRLSKEMNIAVFIFFTHMALIENRIMVSWSYFMKALKSNIWLYSLLFLHMGHCIVLFCFLWQARQSKRLFSSCPHTPVCLNINLSHRIWFLPRTASTQQWGQYSEIPQGFTDISWRPRPCWSSANGRERVIVWAFPTWDSATWCAVLPDRQKWLEVLAGKETGNQYDSQCSC